MRDKKYRIAFFLPTLGGGGAERVMLNLAANLALRQYHVDVVVVSAQGALCNQIPENVRLIDLKGRRVLGAIFSLRHYYNDYSPDIIVSSQNHANMACILARFFSRRQPAVVATIHNTLSMEMDTFYMRMITRFIPFLYRYANAIVSVSSEAADDFSRVTSIPRERVDVIYNPVITQRLLDKKTQPPEDPWLVDATTPIIMAIGRLTRQKNFDMLLRAFNDIKLLTNARLVIYGEGEDRKELQNFISTMGLDDRVKIPGFCANPYAALSKSNLFVLSSSWEGLPTVLIEAMACGVPVISTRCKSGPEEILDHGRLGKLINVGDSSALASAMMELLMEKPLPIPLHELDKYMEGTVCNQYLELMDRI